MENNQESKLAKIRFSFKKEERLCSKKQYEKLFSEGTSFLVYPLKVVYTEIDFIGPFPAKAAFAVSKKLFKKAVWRNLIKRRMREAYRLNKHVLYSNETIPKKAVIFIYVGKKILEYKTIEKAMQRSIALLIKSTTPNP